MEQCRVATLLGLLDRVPGAGEPLPWCATSVVMCRGRLGEAGGREFWGLVSRLTATGNSARRRPLMPRAQWRYKTCARVCARGPLQFVLSAASWPQEPARRGPAGTRASARADVTSFALPPAARRRCVGRVGSRWVGREGRRAIDTHRTLLSQQMHVWWPSEGCLADARSRRWGGHRRWGPREAAQSNAARISDCAQRCDSLQQRRNGDASNGDRQGRAGQDRTGQAERRQPSLIPPVGMPAHTCMDPCRKSLADSHSLEDQQKRGGTQTGRAAAASWRRRHGQVIERASSVSARFHVRSRGELPLLRQGSCPAASLPAPHTNQAAEVDATA
ncbi:hypothetical protein K491DRAFT_204046 [Lophiostoma macrostomum CBS 122681]|uniref:Uncharacterized protein n=1 Tax=Lophiostoma macrostomum CBS 122681 TaxID=1314788 RepID=A0A6A6TIW1_9PLEO|nr:hypothetical protein K491DRAFT_204046 [Lophiostoma macrostomum CBS 122681]